MCALQPNRRKKGEGATLVYLLSGVNNLCSTNIKGQCHEMVVEIRIVDAYSVPLVLL
jgi:hypothetical protein